MITRLLVLLAIVVSGNLHIPMSRNSSIKYPADEVSATTCTVLQTARYESSGGSETHLKDTLTISGNFVLFLRPDSIRFEEYVKDPESHIYEVDSDFGVAISATMDGMSKHKKYKHIQTDVTEKRFIRITDCQDSPRIIDRDTIDYGLIMTSKAKAVKSITFLHSGDYLNDVEGYFKLD